jgi:hypothetical protein
MHLPRLSLLAALTSAPLAAQQANQPAPDHEHAVAVAGGGVFPAGWSVRPDEGGTPAGVKFVPMEPGFHLTMGTAAILYRAEDKASSPAHIIVTMHYFPKKGSPHEEGFGLFIGGKDLDGPAQRYSYFLVRGDGTFKVKRRNGAATTDVASKNWMASDAIPKADPAAASTRYDLSLLIKDGKVSFMVGGKEVYSGAAKDLDTDGIVGLRVNHNLSVHVQDFAIHHIQ